jgi:hypothetical protein
VAELQLSEDAAGRRITTARVARRFPVVLDALDDGRLSLTTVGLLAPHLTEDNAAGLFEAAAGRSKAEIQHLLAARFPRSEMLAWVAEVPGSSAACSDGQHALARVEDRGTPEAELVPERVGTESRHALARVDRSRVQLLSCQSFGLQLTMSRSAHDKLRYLQELLSHQVPSGDIAEVVERAFDLAIGHLEKRKFAATGRPGRGGQRRATASERRIPAHVRRAVWQRDGGRCTFVSETGHRCAARKFIEFDHVQEVARGGEATVAGIRLRCRAHNQYGAECTFGAEFMRHKRLAAAEARAATKARAAAVRTQAASEDEERDVVPWLKQLGFRADEARMAADSCENVPDAPLDERVRAALSYLGRRRFGIGRSVRGDSAAPAV